MTRRAFALHGAALAVLLAAACPSPSVESEISRARAIEIARAQVSFQPDSADAERESVGGRPVWRVTLRGHLPGQPPGLFETAIIEIDRRTGEIVAIGRT